MLFSMEPSLNGANAWCHLLGVLAVEQNAIYVQIVSFNLILHIKKKKEILVIIPPSGLQACKEQRHVLSLQ